jgi:exonuclease III
MAHPVTPRRRPTAESRGRSEDRSSQATRRARRGCGHTGQRPRQRTLGDFFPTVDGRTRERQVRGEFITDRKQRISKNKEAEARTDRRTQRQTAALHPEDRTFSCVTQNVNGFGADEAHRDEWLRAVKRDDSHGRRDVVFLQETHVEPGDVDYFTGLHAKTWGFRVGTGCPTLSFWSPSEDKKGGVAILVDPVQPAMQEKWSPHFMAVTGRHDNEVVLYVCVYAPHQKGAREVFYWGLADVALPSCTRILLGGDFNCTLDARFDRSHYRQQSDHASPGLEALLMRWGLGDAVTSPLDGDLTTMSDFHTQTHTYQYTLPSGEQASARLDRWYTSAELADWVAQVEVCHPGARADHQAVRIHLINPQDPIRIRKPARVYPPPPVAEAQVKEAMAARLTELYERMQAAPMLADMLVQEWEETKTAIRIEALRIVKQRRKTARATFKQKCRRLLRQERRILDALAGSAHTVESITDGMAALTLEEGRGDTPLHRVRNAITDCMRRRLALRQQRLFRQNGYRPGTTTKQFFRRLSTKFGDNVIHSLDAVQGHAARGVHGQPDTMADAWTAIFQQAPGTAADRQRVLRWLGDPGQYATHLAGITEPISEAEVAAAIGSSKPGKACGPDRLGNDWYRDFAKLLIPVLTILLNSWFSGCVVPPSFLEADIFCLKKGGTSRNPLNFRPLSLMNSDYKILTRIMTTRASRKLSRIIHPNQNGFVPHRSIHTTLDLFAAAQQESRRNPEFAAALALLLDFCKAYDSVDGEFLYAVLLWLGFPPEFVAVIRALHEGTRVRFLANGFRSRWVEVTCGIRQGCPLAPLLFLLVLEALYRRIDSHPDITGIELRSKAGAMPIKVGGYADDTASYVKSAKEVYIVMEITRIFAAALGLKLNEETTLVIALNPGLLLEPVLLPAPLRLQAEDQISRYLGIQVGSRPDIEYSWKLAYQQLVTRLALAVQKTTTVDQRSFVVAAVVIPKLLYIGRHQWPTKTIVERLQQCIHNYIWHAQFTFSPIRRKAWLNATVAALPRADGGIAAPSLKLELLAMAASTVASWALWSTAEQQIVGDVLGVVYTRYS